jgi:hypothetical protein
MNNTDSLLRCISCGRIDFFWKETDPADIATVVSRQYICQVGFYLFIFLHGYLVNSLEI